MKGITPVVAIILLLLITISMVGFAFVWFTRIGELTTQQTEEQLQGELTRTGQKIRIESIFKGVDAGTPGPSADDTPMRVVIRNIGSAKIPLTSIVGFKNGINIDCKTDDSTPRKFSKPDAPIPQLDKNEIKTCVDGRTPASVKVFCEAGDKIRITAPGNSDEIACP